VQTRECEVSFESPDGIRHTVSVQASTLHEAAVLAIAAFRRSKLIDSEPGPASRLRVCVRSEIVAEHEISVAKVMRWLESTGKNPQDGAERARLRELLA
jgi:hypothetical protein